MSTPFDGLFPNMKSLQDQISRAFAAGGLGNGAGFGQGNTNSSSGFQGWPFGGMNTDWMSQLSGLTGQGAATTDIPVDVYEAGDDVMVIAELPGLSSGADVTLSVFPDQLVISGQVERHYGQTGGTMHVSERHIGHFERSVELPVRVKRSAARAKYHNGLLEVRLVKNGRAPTSEASSVPIDFL